MLQPNALSVMDKEQRNGMFKSFAASRSSIYILHWKVNIRAERGHGTNEEANNLYKVCIEWDKLSHHVMQERFDEYDSRMRMNVKSLLVSQGREDSFVELPTLSAR